MTTKAGVKVEPGKLILTSRVGINADLFPDVLRLYVPEGSVVADVTWGKGVFWQNVDVTKYVLHATDMSTGTDARKLPYADGSHRAVVLDPPYIYNPKDTVKASISQPYQVNQSTGFRTVHEVLTFYKEAMFEAKRVLTPDGVLIVKCQDQIMSGKQCWMHVEIQRMGEKLGLYLEDLFVLVQKTQPTSRWPTQYHGRKNHSYFMVFSGDKRAAFPLADDDDDSACQATG